MPSIASFAFISFTPIGDHFNPSISLNMREDWESVVWVMDNSTSYISLYIFVGVSHSICIVPELVSAGSKNIPFFDNLVQIRK